MATAKNAPAAPAAPAKKRTPNAAFMKPLTPSPALAAVVGSTPLPRTEIISKLWVYIKQHNLQDASNKRMILARPAPRSRPTPWRRFSFIRIPAPYGYRYGGRGIAKNRR